MAPLSEPVLLYLGSRPELFLTSQDRADHPLIAEVTPSLCSGNVFSPDNIQQLMSVLGGPVPPATMDGNPIVRVDIEYAPTAYRGLAGHRIYESDAYAYSIAELIGTASRMRAGVRLLVSTDQDEGLANVQKGQMADMGLAIKVFRINDAGPFEETKDMRGGAPPVPRIQELSQEIATLTSQRDAFGVSLFNLGSKYLRRECPAVAAGTAPGPGCLPQVTNTELKKKIEKRYAHIEKNIADLDVRILQKTRERAALVARPAAGGRARGRSKTRRKKTRRKKARGKKTRRRARR